MPPLGALSRHELIVGVAHHVCGRYGKCASACNLLRLECHKSLCCVISLQHRSAGVAPCIMRCACLNRGVVSWQSRTFMMHGIGIVLQQEHLVAAELHQCSLINRGSLQRAQESWISVADPASTCPYSIQLDIKLHCRSFAAGKQWLTCLPCMHCQTGCNTAIATLQNRSLCPIWSAAYIHNSERPLLSSHHEEPHLLCRALSGKVI